MTDEQIKQKAEAYATECYGEYDEHDYTDHSGSNMCHAVSEKAFIAGAHSRDEEIEELEMNKWSLEGSRDLWKGEAGKAESKIRQLEKELDNLRTSIDEYNKSKLEGQNEN